MQQPFIGNRDYRQESFQVLFSKKFFFSLRKEHGTSLVICRRAYWVLGQYAARPWVPKQYRNKSQAHSVRSASCSWRTR